MSAWAELLTPPEWEEWSWGQRITYLALLFGGMSVVVIALVLIHKIIHGNG